MTGGPDQPWAERFRALMQALATYVLGPGIETFGSGPCPDGGREASFHGQVPYPRSADPGNGFGTLQATSRSGFSGVVLM